MPAFASDFAACFYPLFQSSSAGLGLQIDFFLRLDDDEAFTPKQHLYRLAEEFYSFPGFVSRVASGMPTLEKACFLDRTPDTTLVVRPSKGASSCLSGTSGSLGDVSR